MIDSASLLAPLYSSAAMRAVVDERTRVQRMLDVEAALARAEAAVGVIPAGAAAPIAAACRVERFDLIAIAAAAPAAGNLLIPLVKALTAEVKTADEPASGFVHWGATSQDIIDTAQVLELAAALDLLVADLDRAAAAFMAQAQRHRDTLMVARTWLQHALPMPFGLKLAGYAGALARARERLARLRREALVLQFGGAAGTLASLGSRGLDVAERLAAELGLTLPDAPWHGQRDRLAEIAAALSILAGTCGKIARDVSLLMQTDVAEACEPAGAGRGGSSTMPHKRNPTASAAAMACATLAAQFAGTILATQADHEHERATGAWQVEWPTIPALLLVTSGALAAVVDIGEGLEVDASRMRANLDATGGLVMAEAVATALGARIGKHDAHALVEAAARRATADKKNLRDVLAADARVTTLLSANDLDRLFDPGAYQGMAQSFIDRIIAGTRHGP
ncbi:3-carboxy-cis,cis-muconate cycloisomerase [Xanthobacteraceae bacterium Astr-EGSB]|uniref:3-carboxy-cis,cis-muconate cycloisomerase n=1 Tax=Astrobacterium formosum TaxID=3069710 RepID=UPI0027B1DF54|nr:3-carboxy-cis,cis-muconate cycloisomerase [Xanthobacteraceae bacterium Astr-EGSB]